MVVRSDGLTSEGSNMDVTAAELVVLKRRLPAMLDALWAQATDTSDLSDARVVDRFYQRVLNHSGLEKS